MDDLISRQQAIDAITDENIIIFSDSVYDDNSKRYKRAVQRILVSLPSAEPQLVNESQGLVKDLVNDLISRQATIDYLIANVPHDDYGDELDADELREMWTERINSIPPAEPQTEINMAYMRGKIDGINYCTERLRKMRMEVEHD